MSFLSRRTHKQVVYNCNCTTYKRVINMVIRWICIKTLDIHSFQTITSRTTFDNALLDYSSLLNCHCAVLDCNEVITPEHVSLSTYAKIYGTVVTAECNPGFMLPDGGLSLNLQCLDTALWNVSLPDCIRIYFVLIVIYYSRYSR